MPIERILFESDAPDAFPKSHTDSSSLLVDNSIALGHQSPEGLATSAPNYPKEELNHPANIQIVSACRCYLVSTSGFLIDWVLATSFEKKVLREIKLTMHIALEEKDGDRFRKCPDN